MTTLEASDMRMYSVFYFGQLFNSNVSEASYISLGMIGCLCVFSYKGGKQCSPGLFETLGDISHLLIWKMQIFQCIKLLSPLILAPPLEILDTLLLICFQVSHFLYCKIYDMWWSIYFKSGTMAVVVLHSTECCGLLMLLPIQWQRLCIQQALRTSARRCFVHSCCR